LDNKALKIKPRTELEREISVKKKKVGKKFISRLQNPKKFPFHLNEKISEFEV
jgi:hypothetical protein